MEQHSNASHMNGRLLCRGFSFLNCVRGARAGTCPLGARREACRRRIGRLAMATVHPLDQAEAKVSMDVDVDSIRRQIESLQMVLKKKVADTEVAPYSRSYGRTLISAVLEHQSEGVHLAGKSLRIGGWIKTGREAGAGAFAFLEVNDGTSFNNLQVVVQKDVAEAHDAQGLKLLTPTGTCVLIEGDLTETPEGTKQKVELKATRLVHVGACDNSAGNYPLSKKKQTFEFLREKAHLRPRTNTIGAVARIRNALASATHEFFQSKGFILVHTPLITTSDCEGAGEMFQVTTLLSKVEENAAQKMSSEQLEEVRQRVATQEAETASLRDRAAADKKDKALKKEAKEAETALQKLHVELDAAERLHRMSGGLPRRPDKSVDYGEDFFGKPSFLTVSGQLNGEYYACGLSNIYTFGPTFRAENSHTSRHLAEFWMIEPEIAFCDLQDLFQCAEDYVQFCCQYLLRTCRHDLDFIVKQIDEDAINRLEHVANTPFKRLSYTDAITELQAAIKEKRKKFENPVEWGVDLASEHERFLTEEVFRQPVIVYDYPAAIKAFYMRLNEDGKTVAAMDVLVPGVGELIGGSQREERLEVLERRLHEAGMPLEPYEGYLDLRRYGTVPHSGFGLGFERLILFATGIENIREVIPFPRWPGHADF